MFVGSTETFPKSVGQPLLYQYIEKETKIIQLTIEASVY